MLYEDQTAFIFDFCFEGGGFGSKRAGGRKDRAAEIFTLN
jgi:hypothetical protein